MRVLRDVLFRPFKPTQSVCQNCPHFEQSSFQDVAIDLLQGHLSLTRCLVTKTGRGLLEQTSRTAVFGREVGEEVGVLVETESDSDLEERVCLPVEGIPEEAEGIRRGGVFPGESRSVESE